MANYELYGVLFLSIFILSEVVMVGIIFYFVFGNIE